MFLCLVSLGLFMNENLFALFYNGRSQVAFIKQFIANILNTDTYYKLKPLQYTHINTS